MTRSTMVKLFYGSLLGLAGGLVLLGLAGTLAMTNQVLVMEGPNVVGIRGGVMAWTLAGLCALALLVIVAAGVAQFVAWVGAVISTANTSTKTWCVVLLVVGLLGFVFVANLVYVIAGPDGSATSPGTLDGTASLATAATASPERMPIGGRSGT